MSQTERPAPTAIGNGAAISASEQAQNIATSSKSQAAPAEIGDNRLPELAAEIRQHVEGARAAARRGIEHAIAVGEALLEAQKLVGHGRWAEWLKEHCDLSERQARKYKRLAKHKDVLPKTALGADLTITAAIDALAEPQWPDKLSQLAQAVRYLPLAGHIRVGERTSEAGIDTVIVAPSYQHPDYCYVTHFWQDAKSGGGSMTGTRRPVRADYVTALDAA